MSNIEINDISPTTIFSSLRQKFHGLIFKTHEHDFRISGYSVNIITGNEDWIKYTCNKCGFEKTVYYSYYDKWIKDLEIENFRRMYGRMIKIQQVRHAKRKQMIRKARMQRHSWEFK
jgi:hypothetical protein